MLDSLIYGEVNLSFDEAFIFGLSSILFFLFLLFTSHCLLTLSILWLFRRAASMAKLYSVDELNYHRYKTLQQLGFSDKQIRKQHQKFLEIIFGLTPEESLVYVTERSLISLERE